VAKKLAFLQNTDYHDNRIIFHEERLAFAKDEGGRLSLSTLTCGFRQ
jgi:uncharacterized protein (DUF2461 family)